MWDDGTWGGPPNPTKCQRAKAMMNEELPSTTHVDLLKAFLVCTRRTEPEELSCIK